MRTFPQTNPERNPRAGSCWHQQKWSEPHFSAPNSTTEFQRQPDIAAHRAWPRRRWVFPLPLIVLGRSGYGSPGFQLLDTQHCEWGHEPLLAQTGACLTISMLCKEELPKALGLISMRQMSPSWV